MSNNAFPPWTLVVGAMLLSIAIAPQYVRGQNSAGFPASSICAPAPGPCIYAGNMQLTNASGGEFIAGDTRAFFGNFGSSAYIGASATGASGNGIIVSGGPAITLRAGDPGVIAWSPSDFNGAPDVAFRRNAIGVVEVNNATTCSGTPANCRDMVMRHMAGAGTAPTNNACAGFALDTGSSDLGGRVSFTSATSCAINFGVNFANPPFCWAMPGSAPSTVQVTRTAAVLTATFGTAQTSMSYGCTGI